MVGRRASRGHGSGLGGGAYRSGQPGQGSQAGRSLVRKHLSRGGGIQVGMASATSEALWPQAPAEGSGQSSRSLGEVFRQTLRLPSRSGVAAALNASPSPLALGTISSPENLSAPSSHQALQGRRGRVWASGVLGPPWVCPWQLPLIDYLELVWALGQADRDLRPLTYRCRPQSRGVAGAGLTQAPSTPSPPCHVSGASRERAAGPGGF